MYGIRHGRNRLIFDPWPYEKRNGILFIHILTGVCIKFVNRDSAFKHMF